MDLASLGWDEFFTGAFAACGSEGLIPARVVSEHKHAYALAGEDGEFWGEVRGRLLKQTTRASLPAVGDWVAFARRPNERRVSIHVVLPRRTAFSRRAAGEREVEQVVAANIDTVFLVTGLDADFNVRRIERYLALARGSGAQPVVLLNKVDLCHEVDARVSEVAAVSSDTPRHVISAERGDGIETLAPYLGQGKTVALLGSSGVGKSTLVNRLIGQRRQAVQPVKEDDGRGRHTTTHRELIPLPGGALLIDTPGMRELQLWTNVREGLLATFPDIVALAARCRFRDCRHGAEPGCGVRAAVASGDLAADRFASFIKLRSELEQREAGVRASRRLATRVKGRRIMRG